MTRKVHYRGLSPAGWGCLGLLAVLVLIGCAVLTSSFWGPVLGLGGQKPPTQIVSVTAANKTPGPQGQVPVGTATATYPPFVYTAVAATAEAQTSLQGNCPVDPAKPSVRVAFPTFGSYLTAVQIAQTMSCDQASYNLVLVPIDFAEDVNAFTEDEQSSKLNSGEWDILFTTWDSPARQGNYGKIAWIIDQSYGADRGAARVIGVVGNCAGKTIESFNAIVGCTVAYADGGPGEFQLLSILKLIGATPNDVVLLPKDDVTAAVAAYNNREADVVFGWEPDILDAFPPTGDARDLVSTAWWRNVVDVAMISPVSNSGKSDALTAFARDWCGALRAQQEDLGTAAEVIASWKYNGVPTNDWTYVGYDHGDGTPIDPLGDLTAALGSVAQAGCPANVIAMQNLPLLQQQVVKAREIWALADNVTEAYPFDLESVFEPRYMLAIGGDPAWIPLSGGFVNPNYQPVPQQPPTAATAGALIELPTVAQLPEKCQTLKFIPDQAVLAPGQEDTVRECFEFLSLVTKTSDVQILITGWSAYPNGVSRQAVESTAQNRAIGIFTTLANQFGVDVNRVAWTYQIPPQEHWNSAEEAINSQYRRVVIELKLAGTGQ